jgi:hypothetical protein
VPDDPVGALFALREVLNQTVARVSLAPESSLFLSLRQALLFTSPVPPKHGRRTMSGGSAIRTRRVYPDLFVPNYRRLASVVSSEGAPDLLPARRD